MRAEQLLLGVPKAKIIEQNVTRMLASYPNLGRDAAVEAMRLDGRMRDFCLSQHNLDNLQRQLDQLEWCKDRGNDASWVGTHPS